MLIILAYIGTHLWRLDLKEAFMISSLPCFCTFTFLLNEPLLTGVPEKLLGMKGHIDHRSAAAYSQTDDPVLSFIIELTSQKHKTAYDFSVLN